MPSQRIRSYAIVTSRPAIHKIARENYTRSKRNVLATFHEHTTTTFFPHFFGGVCSREVLSIERRIRAVVAAKVSQTKAANRRFSRRRWIEVGSP
jgi:hypothetical protein